MCLVGVLSTQVWHERFCSGAASFPEETREPRVVIDVETANQTECVP
jgi:hypothetical protein